MLKSNPVTDELPLSPPTIAAANPWLRLRAVGVFTIKWAVAGLAFAGVLLLLRPDLRTSPTTEVAPPAQAHPSQSVVTPKSEPQAPVPQAPIVVEPVASYADAVARAAPAVVNIYTARIVSERVLPPAFDRFFGSQSPTVRQRVQGSLGAGVIVDTRGHVITNHHVVGGAQQILLQLADGRVADAKLIGADPDSDLALLKIDLTSLPVMPMGRSDRLRIGDVALAIGYPYGLSQSVTLGIVSGTGRDQLGIRQFESFIQTDAAINVGNSGGALINAQGELIGINTAALGSEGIGFAIPVNMVRGVMQDLIAHGRVRRGWLGVGVASQSVSAQRAAALGLKDRAGAELAEIDPDSPAAQAGLEPGDVITALNGRAVRDAYDAMNRVAALKPGSTVRIQGRGARGEFDLRVTVAERR